MDPMEANPTPDNPASASRRAHPADGARKAAAIVSVGTFLALTGGFALNRALNQPAGASPAAATTGATTTPSGTDTSSGGDVVTGQTDDDPTAGYTDGTDTGWGDGGAAPGTYDPGPATTQSSGS